MKNIKYDINFSEQRKKMLYCAINSIEDELSVKLNGNLFSFIKQSNSIVVKDVISKLQK